MHASESKTRLERAIIQKYIMEFLASLQYTTKHTLHMTPFDPAFMYETLSNYVFCLFVRYVYVYANNDRMVYIYIRYTCWLIYIMIYCLLYWPVSRQNITLRGLLVYSMKYCRLYIYTFLNMTECNIVPCIHLGHQSSIPFRNII